MALDTHPVFTYSLARQNFRNKTPRERALIAELQWFTLLSDWLGDLDAWIPQLREYIGELETWTDWSEGVEVEEAPVELLTDFLAEGATSDDITGIQYPVYDEEEAPGPILIPTPAPTPAPTPTPIPQPTPPPTLGPTPPPVTPPPATPSPIPKPTPPPAPPFTKADLLDLAETTERLLINYMGNILDGYGNRLSDSVGVFNNPDVDYGYLIVAAHASATDSNPYAIAVTETLDAMRQQIEIRQWTQYAWAKQSLYRDPVSGYDILAVSIYAKIDLDAQAQGG